jgi:uncharacterized membrane protein
MNQRALFAVAAASLLSSALLASSPVLAQDTAKEKCFGIAKAGENSCANLSGSHSCAGQSTTDKGPGEWKLVAKGTCAKLGGLGADEAKAALAKAGDK